MEWTTAKLGIAADSMLLKATESLAGNAMIVIWVYNGTGAKLDNIIGGNMDVQVSFDFASGGIYATQYVLTLYCFQSRREIFSPQKSTKC